MKLNFARLATPTEHVRVNAPEGMHSREDPRITRMKAVVIFAATALCCARAGKH